MNSTLSKSFLSDKLVSVLIPAYNEENAIIKTIKDLESALSRSGWGYEIIVVDDSSTDGTAQAAKTTGVRVLSHPKNIGYGGALRTGIENASYEWVATIDADCSYPAEELLKLFPFADKHDMVVGARQGKHYWGTLLKYPARILFLAIAQFVVGKKIPDVNSGLRLMKKSIVTEMLPRLSRGFSFSTTITLSFLSSFRFVHFEPIVYSSRVGSSKVRYIRDTLRTLQLMLETIVYYNPIKAGVLLMFLPMISGATCLVISLVKSQPSLLLWSLGFFCGAQVFLAMGLLMFVILQKKSG